MFKLRNGNNFSSLEFFLRVHGFLFISKYKLGFKGVAKFTMQLLFITFFESNMILLFFSRLQRIYSYDCYRRDCIVFTVVLLFECFLRIQLHLKRKKLVLLTKQILRIYNTLSQKSLFPFKYVIFLILLFNDVSSILMGLILASRKKFLDFQRNGDDFYYGFIPPPYSAPIHYTGLFICNWSFMSHFFAVYFCNICLLSKITMREFKNKIIHNEIGFNFLYKTYNDISVLISDLNQSLHTMILISFTLFAGKIFYGCYVILFAKEDEVNSYRFIYLGFTLLISATYFVAMCLFSSSLTNSALELRGVLCDLRINMSRVSKILQFINKVNSDSIGFKILDTLNIDKSLLLATVGNLLTYGILIATFNINSSN